MTTGTARVQFTWNGAALTARDNESLAAALLANGVLAFGHDANSANERAPYCMMGSCFACRVIIDGRPDQQACTTVVREGMAAIADGSSFDLSNAKADDDR